jgi:hypothetical protein
MRKHLTLNQKAAFWISTESKPAPEQAESSCKTMSFIFPESRSTRLILLNFSLPQEMAAAGCHGQIPTF